MKNGKELIKNCIKRGWVQVGSRVLTPIEAASLNLKPVKGKTKHTKTGWIDDTRNIANRNNITDAFKRLLEEEFGVEVWPEFHFSAERWYRFDYAVPEYKIAIEQEGGIHAKGNSGHSSGKGIKRDMDKSSLASVQGWVIIRRIPTEMLTNETLELVKKAIAMRRYIP